MAAKSERPDKMAKLYIEALITLDNNRLAELLKEGDIEIIASRKELAEHVNTLSAFLDAVTRVLEDHGPLVRNKTLMINILSDQVARARQDI